MTNQESNISAENKQGFTYLMSAYSHDDPGIRESRYRAALQCLAFYTANGQVLYSPIVHNHPVASNFVMPSGWDFWSKFDLPFLRASTAVFVLTNEGWRESVGIAAEIEIAKALNLPLSLVSENGVSNYWRYDLNYDEYEKAVAA